MLLNILTTITDEYFMLFMFCLNSFILLVLIVLYFFVRDTKKRWNKVSDYLGDITKTVNSVRYGDLTKKINKLDILDNGNLSESLNRMIETLKDREIMIAEFQKDLLKQNKILERTLNSLSDGLLIVNEDGKIYRATSLVANWFEVDGKSIIEKSIFNFIEISSKKSIQLWENEEIIIPTQKNAKFSISSVELNLDDKKERYMLIIKDITDQKELETLKEDFVATLTHDLKVPIVAETNMIELFLNENFGPISEKQKLALKNMQTSNKELLDLVQTVLETYKIAQIKLYKENFLLKGFINDVLEEMRPIAQKSNNNLDFILERDIQVLADKFQLKRVLKNLIQNAILYGKPNTPIEIKIGEIPRFVVITVKDYGKGISKTDVDRIFNKYYSAAKKFRKIGTGLGLYLALQIIKAHNGELTVESVEGEYSEFLIKLPVKYEHHSLPY